MKPVAEITPEQLALADTNVLFGEIARRFQAAMLICLAPPKVGSGLDTTVRWDGEVNNPLALTTAAEHVLMRDDEDDRDEVFV